MPRCLAREVCSTRNDSQGAPLEWRQRYFIYSETADRHVLYYVAVDNTENLYISMDLSVRAEHLGNT